MEQRLETKNNDVIVDLYKDENGRIGALVDLPKTAQLNNGMAQVYEPTGAIIKGIESIDLTGFAEGGPGGEIGTADYSDITACIVVHLPNENYRQSANTVNVYGANLEVVDSRIATITQAGGKGFKPFKLED